MQLQVTLLMADIEIDTAWPKHMVKPCDTRELINIITPISLWYKAWFKITFVVVQNYRMIIDVVTCSTLSSHHTKAKFNNC